MGFRFDPYRRSMSFYPQLLSGRSGGLALSHSSRVMMSSILPVVFFTHCRCGPELRPFLMFLPGPVLSEYLANTGVPSRSVSQCWNSPLAVGPSSSGSGSRPPSRAKNPPSSSWLASWLTTFRSASYGLVLNGEVSFAVVGPFRCAIGAAWWGFGVVGLGGRTSSGGGGWWLGGVWCGCILRCRT